MINNDHLEMYEKFISVFLELNDSKRMCYILHSLANTGKTQIMKRLAEIFHSYKHFENKGKFCEELVPQEYATQIGLFDDFAKEKIFGAGNEGIAKVFMEGGGLPWEEKFKAPYKAFVNCYSFMSFNELPECLEPEAPEGEIKKAKNLRVPFVARCTYIEFTK